MPVNLNSLHECRLLSPIVMIVPIMMATTASFSPVRAITSPLHTVSVLPALTTCARDQTSPTAGRRRLILYSTVSASTSAGIRLRAA